MNCPFCQSSQIIVVNSRSTKKNTQIWRRRKCQTCGLLFTTYENIDLSYLVVIKKSGEKERYSRAKLFSSVYHAAVFEKRVDRGDAGTLAEKIIQEVEREILVLKRKRISSLEIFKLTCSILKKENYNVYLRYFSYFQKVTRRGLID